MGAGRARGINPLAPLVRSDADSSYELMWKRHSQPRAPSAWMRCARRVPGCPALSSKSWQRPSARQESNGPREAESLEGVPGETHGSRLTARPQANWAAQFMNGLGPLVNEWQSYRGPIPPSLGRLRNAEPAILPKPMRIQRFPGSTLNERPLSVVGWFGRSSAEGALSPAFHPRQGLALRGERTHDRIMAGLRNSCLVLDVCSQRAMSVAVFFPLHQVQAEQPSNQNTKDREQHLCDHHESVFSSVHAYKDETSLYAYLYAL